VTPIALGGPSEQWLLDVYVGARRGRECEKGCHRELRQEHAGLRLPYSDGIGGRPEKPVLDV